MSRTRELLLLVVASLAAATSTPLGKVGAEMAAPALAAARTGLAAIVILAIVPRATARAIAALPGKKRAALFGAGALLAAHFTLFLAGVARTSLPAAAALIAVEPLAVVLVSGVAFRAPPSPFEAAGIALAMIGGAIVARGPEIGEHRVLGDALIVAAVVFYAFYVAAARALRDAMPPWPYAGSVYAIAAIVALPFALVMQRHAPSARACASAAGLAIVPTLVGHTLIQRLARTSTPAVVGLVSPGEALGSIAIGMVMLGAWPTAREQVGGAIVIAGTLLALVSKRR